MRTGLTLLFLGVALTVGFALFYWLIVAGDAPQHLKVPEGFLVEVAAGPPLVERPISVDFDERGRLYVTESSGSNDPVEQQLEEKPHYIKRLEDTDGDGRFDKSTIFADGMMMPQGALWFEGSLYVAAPPSIWKLTDIDDDGVADHREEWFQGRTLTHCANDLHGPYLGLDGWIYWTKGAFAEQTYERPGKPSFVTRAGHIFRRRPGDSLIEPVLTGGMDNPVDVVFTARGERLLAATFLEHPKAGRRDAIIHAIYGGVYGKPHNVLEGHARTGELLPPIMHLGPAVPSAQTIYQSGIFGADYQGNLFVCQFNLNKVTRHVLEVSGATFQSRDIDFLVSSNRDFRPTDVIEDADGSLLVVDTGGWYKLCCPTSQLAKPDVPGGIYRIRPKHGFKVRDPRGLEYDWENADPVRLTALLGDDRPAVHSRAIQELARRGPESLPVLARKLRTSKSVETRRNIVWALTRIGQPEARQAVRQALNDENESVRQAAVHSIAAWRDAESVPALLETLSWGTAPLQRVAAEALGRIGDSRAVAPLLALTGVKNERVLEHSLTYALIEIADPAATAAGLSASSPYTLRAALIALDQMEGGRLQPDDVVPLLTSDRPVIRQTALWIVGNHPEWGASVAGFFRDRLADPAIGPEERIELQRQLSGFGGDAAIQALLASTLVESTLQSSRLIAIRAMAESTLKELPVPWAEALAEVLRAGDRALTDEAVAALQRLPVPAEEFAEGIRDALLEVGRDQSFTSPVRLRALAAIPGNLESLDADLFDLLSANLGSGEQATARGIAAGVLAKSNLSRDQLVTLTDSIRSAGPLELSTLVEAFRAGGDEELGRKFLAALRSSTGLFSLRADVMSSTLAEFPRSIQQQGEQLLASLEMDPVRQRARLETLLASLAEGDVRRGQEVFNSNKAACAACHAIGYLGGNSGPDLTRIGEVRTRRDLLESILFPSAGFVRGYESVLVETESGDRHQGVITEESPDEILLVTGVESEVRVVRSQIREIRPSNVSVMPAGLENQLSGEELADLLAFLENTRRGP